MLSRDRRRATARHRDDHRRERHHPDHGVHPLRARDRRGQGVRVHPGRRHDRLAVHGGGLHPGVPRPLGPLAVPALAGARSGPAGSGSALALRLHAARASGSSRSRGRSSRSARSRSRPSSSTWASTSSRARRITAGLEKAATVDEVRDALEKAGHQPRRRDPEVDERQLGTNVVRDPGARSAAGPGRGRSKNALDAEFGLRRRNGFESTTVGPTFGQQVARAR